jgi:hypothetical protein
MLNGIATTAYLNILTRAHHHAGVRRSNDSFVRVIQNENKKHGSLRGFASFVKVLTSMQTGDHIIDWEDDPLIFLQIFLGHPECGHWALVVVDRTVWKPGIVVLFDSLPGCCPATFGMLQEELSGSPLTREGCKWIQADMPRQGKATNDCGVWMCCMASLYVKHVLDHDLLTNPGKEEENMISRVSVVSTTEDTTKVGGDGRIHIMKTIRNGVCCLNDPVFASLKIIHK